MSGVPPNVCRRSARLAAKRGEPMPADVDGAALSRPAVETDAFASTSGRQSAVAKRKATGRSTRAAQPAKKLKTAQEAGEGRKNTRTNGQDRAQRVSRSLEGAGKSSADAKKPNKDRKKKSVAETSPMLEGAATAESRATKRRKTQAEVAPSEGSRQAERSGRPSTTSRSSAASEPQVSSSGSYRTAGEIASSAGHSTPTTSGQEGDTLQAIPDEVDTRFDRLRRVWRWLMASDLDQSGGPGES